MGEGYGNFQCSTLANAIKFIHMQLQITSDKEVFLYIRLRMTPQYSIDRSQRRKNYYMDCTQQLGHHACEVNGFVLITYMRAVYTCCRHIFLLFNASAIQHVMTYLWVVVVVR